MSIILIILSIFFLFPYIDGVVVAVFASLRIRIRTPWSEKVRVSAVDSEKSNKNDISTQIYAYEVICLFLLYLTYQENLWHELMHGKMDTFFFSVQKTYFLENRLEMDQKKPSTPSLPPYYK